MFSHLTQCIRLLSLWLLFGVFAANANIQVIYLAPESQQETQAKQAILDSEVNLLLVELSKQHFPFKNKLTIRYGGDEGPLYDPQEHTMLMPYSFYNQALHYFEENQYQEKFGRSAQSGAIDTILHTLLHEAGHAYIEDQSIPILGKEEDAVDNFAAVIMLEYVEDGDNAAISAADMFAFESEDRPEYYQADEYIGEHSFDLQRYFSTLCLVFGSDPQKHVDLLNEIDKDLLNERKDNCVSQYQIISNNWHIYLKNKDNTYF
ncbi:hypothetical protein BIY21_07275 [Vibrio ponticus]|uniref:Metallopeptidase DUF4344 n=1 Tax=Vibrio ponticus TaxID=265668 RepID=A0ABX3FRE9_9VIBR|nr:DUF4344 domain-containing metallopeptidase [Vibrio ponticus]OLQ95013.1 hypothetical protein BIY21_07275 [Vibrio ponticus]